MVGFMIFNSWTVSGKNNFINLRRKGRIKLLSSMSGAMFLLKIGTIPCQYMPIKRFKSKMKEIKPMSSNIHRFRQMILTSPHYLPNYFFEKKVR